MGCLMLRIERQVNKLFATINQNLKRKTRARKRKIHRIGSVHSSLNVSVRRRSRWTMKQASFRSVLHGIKLSLDDKIDASRALTTYNKLGVLTIEKSSKNVKRFVKNIINQGKIDDQINKLNRDIVVENMRIYKPTADAQRVYEMLINQ